ncbi:hypothetical protein [Ravibacter arvi]
MSLGLMIVSAAGWVACSSNETKDAYDKFYGKGRSAREAEAVVADSIKRAERKSAREAEAAAAVPAAAPSGSVSLTPPAEVAALMEKNTCSVCHKAGERLVGPPWVEVAKKKYSIDEIVALVHEPKPEHWPDYPPMAPLAFVTKEDITVIGTWINSLNQ